MFASVTRRVTIWYVFVAIALAAVVYALVTGVAFAYYARSIDETLRLAILQVPDFEPRARQRQLTFDQAATELERRLQRPGVIVRVLPPAPQPAGGGKKDVIYIRREIKPGPRGPEGSRFGIAVTALLGVQPERARFYDGVVVMYADPERVNGLVTWAALLLLPILGLAGLVAFFAARATTARTIEPLVQVTEALQRFAARDFSPRSVGARGGDFDILARAYNAAAQQVAEAFDERRQTEERMRQFVADAGHELRTPLTIVLGYIEMLRRRAADDEKTRRMFETITVEGSRMRTLVDNLVLLAKMEGSERREAEPFDIRSLVERVVDARRPIAPHTVFTVDAAVDAIVIADHEEVYEALANVVDNALKYAPGSPIDIAIEAAGDGIDVVVRDRGPGIAEDDRAHVFERFYRGATRGDVEGSGLGLAIARRALERSGGTLRIAATSPEGTTFALHLRADEVRSKQARTLPV